MQQNLIQHFRQSKKILIMTMILAMISFPIIMASEIDSNRVTPAENQYLELRAVSVREIEGQNKQVIMELWGNNVEFKRN